WQPEELAGYQKLASSLAAVGTSREAIEEVLLLGEKHARPDEVEITPLEDRANLDIWVGDFEGALRTAEELERRAAGSETYELHLRAAFLAAETRLEMGEGAEAASIAERFWRRKEAWAGGGPAWDSAYQRIVLLAMELEQGRL